MTIRKKPWLLWRRQLGAMAVCAAILYLVAATAFSDSVRSAVDTLSRESGAALAILRSQLGDGREESTIPASVTLALDQVPVLLAGEEAVEGLRHLEESDEGDGQDGEGQEENPAPDTVPLPEEPIDPGVPLVIVDNGVPAKTLLPSSPDGYIVTGGVFIYNRSDREFDATLFDGSFDAALREGEGPKVLIVHTHGSEAYTQPDPLAYESSGDWRTTDPNYNVVRVGDMIAATLEEAGIETLHDPTLHDYPEYSGAYDRALEAIEGYLAEYPTISFVLDVHRDAISDTEGNMYKVVSNVAGLNAAQLALVIGTDGGGLEHPRWRENLKLAAALQQHMTESYPTLMRPITVRNSRYNEHATTGSLLVEVGAAGNSLEEALLSAKLLGQSLAELLLQS